MVSRSRPLSLICTVLAVYAGFCALLFFLQDGFIFIRQPLSEAGRLALREAPGVTGLEIEAADGARLRGWLRHSAGEAAAPGLVIYFGGNAEEVSGTVLDADALAPWSFAAFNYRGYGQSEGKPGESALAADALLAFDRLAARADVAAERIVVFGRSLGSGVAVQLAAARPVRGVVLVSPMDSVRSIARKTYPFVPVSLLLRHPFDSLARAPGIDAPLLVLAGENDRIIPPDRSRRLHDAWAGPTRWEAIPERGHNDLHAHPRYWPAIREFLTSLQGQG